MNNFMKTYIKNFEFCNYLLGLERILNDKVDEKDKNTDKRQEEEKDQNQEQDMEQKNDQKQENNNKAHRKATRVKAHKKNCFPVPLRKELYIEKRLDGKYDHRCREETLKNSKNKEERYSVKFSDEEEESFYEKDKYTNYEDFVTYKNKERSLHRVS